MVPKIMNVFVVREADWGHEAVTGIFSTKEFAQACIVRCKGTLLAYWIEEWTLDGECVNDFVTADA